MKQDLRAAAAKALQKLRKAKTPEQQEAVCGPVLLTSADPPPQMEEVAACALRGVCRLIKHAAHGAWGASPTAHELLRPFASALARLGVSGGFVGEALAIAEEKADASVASRKPLMWRKKDTLVVKSLAPKLIEGYVVRKDEGADRQQARTKQLQRQVKREKKGAMRELRRDAAFLDAEKVREQREKEEERRKTRKSNLAWLEEQQATINQQVKKSKGDALQGGGAGVKRSIMGR